MNFMSILETKGVTVELKYCERCGGIWLRPQGDGEVYCQSCRVRQADMPQSKGARASRPRLPRPKALDLEGRVHIEYLQAVTELEVRP